MWYRRSPPFKYSITRYKLSLSWKAVWALIIKGFLSYCSSSFSLITLATLFFIITLYFTINTLLLTFLSWRMFSAIFSLLLSTLFQTLLIPLDTRIGSHFLFLLCELLQSAQRESLWVSFCGSWRQIDRCFIWIAYDFWRREWYWRIW